MDWGAEGLLDGLEGEAREGRRRLLDELHGDGVDLEDLRAAVAEDRLVLVPIERALMSAARHTLGEVAEQAGLPLDVVEVRLRAMGLHVPEDRELPAYADEDLEMARRARAYLDAGIPAEEARAVGHVLSGAMARVADPVRSAFAEALLRPGDTELDLARRFTDMAERLLPLLVADLEYLLRHHLRERARSDALGMDERATGRLPDAVDAAVAFADIVGFTRLGEEVAEVELTGIAQRLEDLATATLQRPARLVKSIGDAVMLVCTEPRPLVESVLALMDAAGAADGMPPLRAGIAWGRAVPRLGDWYGPTVNLAARVCGRARPESVLATNAVRDALGDTADAYAWSEAGFKRLKGIGDPVPALRLRRRDPDVP